MQTVNGTILGVVLASLLGGTAFAQDVTIKYAHPTSANSSGGIMANDFKATLEDLSGGTIRVQVFPDGQLGSLSELNELAASGTVQVTANTWGSLSVFDEQAGALDAPYVFENPRQRYELLTHENSEILNDLNARLAESGSGLKVLSPVDSAGRQATCNRAIYSPSDLAGVKFRAIPFPVFIATVKGMGGIPVPIEYSELTTALATGLADCQENPLSNILNDKLYEAQTHIMLTNHILAGGPMLINSEFFEGLTAEQKSWVEEAAVSVAGRNLAEAETSESVLRSKLEDLDKIFITTDDGLDVDAFKEGVAIEMKAAFGDTYDAMFEQIESEKKALLN